MSSCRISGGPEWLFELAVSGVFAAFVALGFFVVLQSNARFDAKAGKDPERHRNGHRTGLLVVAGFIVIDRVDKGLTEDLAFPLVMAVPLAAAVLTVRVARRQAAEVPLAYLMPLSAVRGPAR